jgi:hypothetical protein
MLQHEEDSSSSSSSFCGGSTFASSVLGWEDLYWDLVIGEWDDSCLTGWALGWDCI